jgi:hypothetical protein
LCISSLALAQHQQQARKELPVIADQVFDVTTEMFESTKAKRNALADGDELWLTFDGPNRCTGSVYVIEQAYGELGTWESKGYIGGDFDSLDGKLVRGIGKFESYENHIEIGGGVSGGAVYAICDDSTNLFVAGNFKQAGDKPVQNIARWDGNEWHPLGAGTDSTILALCVVNDLLYVGGNFTHAGGVPANYIAVYDILNDEWKPIVVDGVNGMDGGVATLATDGAIVYAGGGFMKAGPITVMKIAAYDNDKWLYMGGVQGINAYVAAIEYSDELHVGGSFSRAGSVNANNIAKFNLLTSSWQPVQQGFDGPVYAISPPNDNFSGGYKPYVVCGEFKHSGLTELNNIATTGFGNNWEPWGSGLDGPGYAVQANSYVFVAFQSQSNMVLVGGAFTKAGNKQSTNFAIHYDPSKDANDDQPEDFAFALTPNHITNNNSRIELAFSQPQPIHLCIVDALGREVITLSQNEVVVAEQYSVDGSTLPTGLYCCVLKTPSRQEMRKLLVSH